MGLIITCPNGQHSLKSTNDQMNGGTPFCNKSIALHAIRCKGAWAENLPSTITGAPAGLPGTMAFQWGLSTTGKCAQLGVTKHLTKRESLLAVCSGLLVQQCFIFYSSMLQQACRGPGACLIHANTLRRTLQHTSSSASLREAKPQ